MAVEGQPRECLEAPARACGDPRLSDEHNGGLGVLLRVVRVLDPDSEAVCSTLAVCAAFAERCLSLVQCVGIPTWSRAERAN